ncbi:DUF4145 domain-containing protein [Marinimicrobium sp. C2-29]|uniref:DUF4145 domain-containing protein n=1 Tax=Marinimicrobium sp. C2-29 TaxID=3139825 RepID=UPI003138C002
MTTYTTDIDISKSISKEIHYHYSIALEFINSKPDYSLMKFREVINSIICKLANNNNINFEDDRLFSRINHLFKCQIVNHLLKDNLHAVRKLGNSGVHYTGDFDEAANFHKFRVQKLAESAHKARGIVSSILEDIYYRLVDDHYLGVIELAPAGQQDYREILYEALLATDPTIKLKAGIICESILDEQYSKSGPISSNEFLANIANLKSNALAFYDASCVISANIDSRYRTHGYELDPEKTVQNYSDIEALFRYSKLATDRSLVDGFHILDEHTEKGMSRLKSAAEREYSQAQALYGSNLYQNEKYDSALKYLVQAQKKDEVLALQCLYYFYSEGNACDPNFELALEYINRAIELGCPDSLAILGAAHHKGEAVPKDDIKAEELLTQSINLGSSYGKRYFSIEFQDLAGSMANQLKAFGESLQRAVDANKPKPIKSTKKIGRNESCYCGSGKKYKKCCA